MCTARLPRHAVPQEPPQRPRERSRSISGRTGGTSRSTSSPGSRCSSSGSSSSASTTARVETSLAARWASSRSCWAIWLLLKFLSWTRTYFVVTDQRVVYRTGVLSRHGVEIPLDRINNINFHQRMFERIIGAGNLEIQSAGEQGTTRFDNVRHPDGVQQEIYRQMEGDATRDAGRGADAVGKAVADALAKQAGRRWRRPDGPRADRGARAASATRATSRPRSTSRRRRSCSRRCEQRPREATGRRRRPHREPGSSPVFAAGP